jgi:threonine dehydrogenase-like Zn-dependent dehydrogenase
MGTLQVELERGGLGNRRRHFGIWVQLSVNPPNHFNIGSLMERGIRLINNDRAPVYMYWDSLLKMIQDKQIDPLKIVTHCVDLDKVYYKFDEKAGRRFSCRCGLACQLRKVRRS